MASNKFKITLLLLVVIPLAIFVWHKESTSNERLLPINGYEGALTLKQLEVQISKASAGSGEALTAVMDSLRHPPVEGTPFNLYIELANQLHHETLKRHLVEILKGRYNCTTPLLQQRLHEVKPPEYFTQYPPETRECSPEDRLEFDGYLSKFTF